MASVTLNLNEELLVQPDAASAARLAAERTATILSARGAKSVALAGGRTPAMMYRLLTEPPLRERVNWNSIEWFWGDERCVPPDHPDSNFRMAMETLLGPLGVASDRIHRMPADAADLDAAAREHEETIRGIVPADAQSVPQFDLILLGIGADGHTASLFPGSEGLKERVRLVIAHYAPGPQAMRMTMTYPLLWAARQIVFLACGTDKAEALERILDKAVSDQQSAVSSDSPPPAAAVRQAGGHITWVLDAAAARLLPA